MHPYRLAYAQGALYLLAYVPEYREVRTFAFERIHELSLLEDTFTPIEELPEEAFPHLARASQGSRARAEFQPAVSNAMRARTHGIRHQQLSDADNGGVACWTSASTALSSWI